MEKRMLALGLTVILIVGVMGVVGVSVYQLWQTNQMGVVTGLIGSEKADFFRDPQVIELLAKKYQLEVKAQSVGSRTIVDQVQQGKYDFAFPAGAPSAERIIAATGKKQTYNVFFTPMAVASWQDIAQMLADNGLAKKQANYYTLDLKGLLDIILIDKGKRWNELKNNTTYPVNKSILIASTDVRSSNSAAMYLALASFVVNDNNIIQSSDILKVVDPMANLFLKQGFVEGTSALPFDNYLVMGKGQAPLVMIYESQFIEAAAKGNLRPEMVLMYPEPTIFTRHILIALTEAGDKLGQALMNGPDLQKLAVEYGLRNNNVTYFREFKQAHKINVADDLVNVVEPPRYEVLEDLIKQIEQKYTGGN